MGIIARGRLEQREYRQIVFGAGGREHIEVIAVIKAVPADIAVGLGVKPVTAAGCNAAFFAITGTLLPLPGGGDNGCAIAGKRQVGEGKQPSVHRFLQKFLLKYLCPGGRSFGEKFLLPYCQSGRESPQMYQH